MIGACPSASCAIARSISSAARRNTRCSCSRACRRIIRTSGFGAACSRRAALSPRLRTASNPLIGVEEYSWPIEDCLQGVTRRTCRSVGEQTRDGARTDVARETAELRSHTCPARREVLERRCRVHQHRGLERRGQHRLTREDSGANQTDLISGRAVLEQSRGRCLVAKRDRLRHTARCAHREGMRSRQLGADKNGEPDRHDEGRRRDEQVSNAHQSMSNHAVHAVGG